MTAEVVIMNKGAVALAADSAVTMQGGKIFNSANKLFMLAPGYPIGILLFNNIEFMSIPWEILIKKYRDEVILTNKPFSTLESCAESFVQFITAHAADFFPVSQQKRFLAFLIQATMKDDIRATVRKKLQKIILDTATKVTDEQVANICHEVVNNVCASWLESTNLPTKKSPEELYTDFYIEYGELFDTNYDLYLSTLPITDEDKQKLKRTLVCWIYKDLWFQIFFSGIVFAGYGTDELFPCCVSYQFESYLCHELKYKKVQHGKITIEQHGMVLPFAQQDMAATFLGGIHPNHAKILLESLDGFITTDFPEVLVNSMTGLNEEQKNSLRQHIQVIGKQRLQETLSEMEKNIGLQYTSPIMQIVSALPKDELATMAETLVSLTSFMRRVSRSQETVGGPVDVAIISKKDGFIWIKRKHYFDREYNYHFFAQEKNRGNENE